MKSIFITIIVTGILFIIALGIREYSKDESQKKHQWEGDIKKQEEKARKGITVTELSGWEEVEKPVFCVKVKPHGNLYYMVVFTNDNFDTEEAITELIDLTMFGDASRVIANPWLVRTEKEAIRIGKRFTSYEKCIEHNKKIARGVAKLLEKYKRNPPVNQYPKAKPIPQRETVIYCEKN